MKNTATQENKMGVMPIPKLLITMSLPIVLLSTWKKYPASIASWRNNWPQLFTYFKYPSEIRKLIYTTNSIENFNRQLRKVTKAKKIFPTDDALFKSLYLAMMDATKNGPERPGIGA